jgi:hypothetical protein
MRKETMRRLLPQGAEATMIMVGDFEALSKPIFLFLRMAESAFMFNVTERSQILYSLIKRSVLVGLVPVGQYQ